MTLRTKSRGQQWMVWLCVAVACTLAFVLLSLSLYGSVSWNLLMPRPHRLALPLLALFVCIAWETRWDGIVREEKVGRGGERRTPSSHATFLSREKKEDVRRPSTPSQDAGPVFAISVLGEEFYNEALALSQGLVPDLDDPCLELLGRSAETGYAPAEVKLGEYAMCRGTWVEAYYWMSRAKRHGMDNLSSVLRQIRTNWMSAGFQDEGTNVHALFSEEDGSVARALLDVDSGHNAFNAREFLREYHPEYL